MSIVSDNGPCFVSAEFSDFVRLNGIHHITTAVYKPSTNGLAENMVKSFKNFLKVNKEGDMQKRIDQFLLRYRITPHTTTGVSPSKLMFNRNIRTVFDLLKPKEIADRVLEKQRKQKYYHDPKHGRNFNVDPDDRIFVRNFNSDKKWIPATVVDQTGPLSYKCVTEDNKIVKRHQDQMIDNPRTVPEEVIMSPVRSSVPDPVILADPEPAATAVPASLPLSLGRPKRNVKPPDRLNL